MFRAQELLETSDSPLSEIAELCGYMSLETFRVAFRRALGTSPAAYRARFRQPVRKMVLGLMPGGGTGG
jgi:AraC family transcriptional activator FtrA